MVCPRPTVIDDNIEPDLRPEWDQEIRRHRWFIAHPEEAATEMAQRTGTPLVEARKNVEEMNRNWAKAFEHEGEQTGRNPR